MGKENDFCGLTSIVRRLNESWNPWLYTKQRIKKTYICAITNAIESKKDEKG